MLDETNHLSIQALTRENDGESLIAAVEELHRDPAKAEAIGKAAQHLGREVLHPDNIDR